MFHLGFEEPHQSSDANKCIDIARFYILELMVQRQDKAVKELLKLGNLPTAVISIDKLH